MSLGFIILRHVKNETTNTYWLRSYHSIRKYFPENAILIIDDSSDYTYIHDEPLYNTTVLQSEYPQRGELLPYYYYLHNKLFDTAVILHDSVFVNRPIDFTVDKYKLIWEFEHQWDQIEDETHMIRRFNDPELLAFYENKSLWKGCFGGMSIITHDYLQQIHAKYDISKLLDCIITRYNRCSFERVIGCLLQKEYPQKTLLGNIHAYCDWGILYDDLKESDLPLVKVWTGR